MVRNKKKIIILTIFWIITIILTLGAPITFIIATVLYILGLKRIKEKKDLTIIYILFAILTSIVVIVSVVAMIFTILSATNTNYSTVLHSEFEKFYNDVFLEELYYGDTIEICTNKGLYYEFVVLCKHINKDYKILEKSINDCIENILTSLLCSKNKTWYNYFFESCYEIIENICSVRAWNLILTSICNGDHKKICSDVYNRFCDVIELERYCSILYNRVCSLDLEKYCKDLETQLKK